MAAVTAQHIRTRVSLAVRTTRWNVVNGSVPGGPDEARLIVFSPHFVQRFHDSFSPFAATPAVQGCAGTAADLADRVQRLVSQRPHAAWTLDELAAAFHLVASTLQRRLGEEGTTASRCVREVRLESALALLRGSSLQGSEIVARCGHDPHSRFTAAFCHRFGYAPSPRTCRTSSRPLALPSTPARQMAWPPATKPKS